MRVARIRCPRDRRPPDAGISAGVRLFVHSMRNAGFTFELQENGRLRVRPSRRINDQLRHLLRGLFHEIRQLLLEEERPQ